MKKLIWTFAGASTLFAASMAVIAADMPTTEPGKHSATTHPAMIRVEAPYNKLDGLTDVQKSKLAEIHKKALADMKAIKDQEEVDSREVLTDDQKAALDKIIAEKKEEMSEKNKTRKAPKSTTAPAE